jgi:hypothetical protein
MRRTLALHPDSRCNAVTRIDVEATRPSPGHLVVRYTISGRIADLRLPHPAASARTDELWRHTCFEAFLRPPSGDAYYEFNFAPSTQWAVYAFSSYRSGMRVANDVGTPFIEVQRGADFYVLQASLDREQLAHHTKDALWRLGLSAVIEEESGAVSYWALQHPPGRADFHHSDCFALELASA